MAAHVKKRLFSQPTKIPALYGNLKEMEERELDRVCVHVEIFLHGRAIRDSPFPDDTERQTEKRVKSGMFSFVTEHVCDASNDRSM